MKQIGLFYDINAYYSSIEEKKHAIQNASKAGGVRNEKYLYDRVAFTQDSNPQLFSIFTGNGWNYTFQSAVTVSELRKLSYTDIFDNIAGNTALTSFDEFKYCEGFTVILDNMFSGCTSLTSLTIPRTVKKIQTNSFATLPQNYKISYAGDVSEIIVSDKIGSIFAAYSGLTETTPMFYSSSTVSISGLSNSLEPFIYVSGQNINRLVFLDELNANKPGNAFSVNSAETIYVQYFLKDNVVNIVPSYAFSGCSALTVVEFDDIIEDIGVQAFMGCYIGEIKFGKSVKTIGYRSFSMERVTTIELPEGLQSIGEYGFSTSLKRIIVHSKSAPKIAYNTFYEISNNGTLYAPSGSDYSAWMNTDHYYLGYYGWTISNDEPQPIPVPDKKFVLVYNASSTTVATRLFSSAGNSYFESQMLVNGEEKPIASSYTFSTTGLQTVICTAKGNSNTFANGLFRFVSQLESAIIPELITSLPTSAFGNCVSLTSVTLPNTIKSLGAESFISSESLSQINLPDSITSIGASAFSFSALESVVIPSGVTTIGGGCFYACRSLTSVTIPNTTKLFNAGYMAFERTPFIESGYCSQDGNLFYLNDFLAYRYVNKTSPCTLKNTTRYINPGCFSAYSYNSITIPDSVTYIAPSTFRYCSASTVTLSNNITAIADDTFKDSGIENIVIPDRVTSIGDSSFANCTKLKTVTIGSGIKNIDYYSFGNCTNLESVAISSGINGLDFSARVFSGDTKLGEINLPEGVGVLYTDMFNKCISLTGLTIPSTARFYTYYDPIIFSKDCYFTRDSLINLSNYTGYPFGATIISSITQDGLVIEGTSIKSYKYNSSVTSVTIPDYVTDIPDYCFRSCAELKSITIPDSVVKIGVGAFDGTEYFESGHCPTYGNIYYPNNVVAYKAVTTTASTYTLKNGTKSITENCFYNCKQLSSMTVGESVDFIGGGAFSGTPFIESGYCTVIGNIYYPNSHVAYKAVSGASSYDIDTGTTCISPACFSGAGRTTASGVSITIPDSVKEINKDTFSGAIIKYLDIGNGITSLDNLYGYVTYTSERAYLKTLKIGHGVTQIPSSAYSGYTKLEEITIGSGVTSIGNYAFYGLSALTSITMFSREVPSVDDYYTFQYIKSGGTLYYPSIEPKYATWVSGTSSCLGRFKWSGQTFDLPISESDKVVVDVTYQVSSTTNATRLISSSGLVGVDKMIIDNTEVTPAESYRFPTTGQKVVRFKFKLNVMPDYAFGADRSNMALTAIKSVVISGKPFKINTGAFAYCTKMENVSIPSEVTKIDSQAFYMCYSLQNVTIPGTITTIGDSAFYSCATLSSFAFRDGLQKIGVSAFYRCCGLTSAILPNTVTSIGGSCFNGCSGITEARLSDRLTEIPYYAFASTKISAITIPDSVVSLGYNCFSNTNLVDVVIPDSVEKCTNHPNSSSYSGYCFANCLQLTGITFGCGLKSSQGFFNGCTALTRVTIPVGVNYLGANTFGKCSSLTSIDLPNGLTNIGQYAFSDCTNLSRIVMPNTVTYVGDFCFRNCTSLTSVTFSDGITSNLGYSIFQGCSQLSAVTLPRNLSTIYMYQMTGNTYLKKIVIGENTTNIYDGAFNNLEITSITIPNSVTGIGVSAFTKCKSLTQVIIGDGVKTIGEKCFSECTSLTSVTVGSGVSEFGFKCFNECSSLSRITCNGVNAPLIQSDTFNNVKTGGTLYYPAGSNYARWLGPGKDYLGYYGWTGQETS